MSSLSQYNAEVPRWTRDTKRMIKNRILGEVLNVGYAYEHLESGTKRYMGETNRIWFGFPYYMVFVHKGAGRGYGGNGSRNGRHGIVHQYSRADGSKGQTSPASFGRMGTGKRQPKPWFNPVIEQQFPELADIVTNYR